MIEASEMQPFEALYTFVDSAGVNVHIASKRLERWAQSAGLEVILTPIDRELAKMFVRDNIVAASWLAHMLERIEREKTSFDVMPPILLAKDEQRDAAGRENVMLVDGHHRYVVHAMIGCPFIRTICLETTQWEPFRVVGVPDCTQEELKRMPVIKELR